MLLSLLTATLLFSVPNDTVISLTDVTVTADAIQHNLQMTSSSPTVFIRHDYLESNFSSSLMKTLGGIPGVRAHSIGSSWSKPAIRGMGWGRMVVTEDGIKHEGQQWGDDHGLETDQFAIDHAEVVKGPAALLYGSGAIGGVLCLFSNHIPTEKFAGSVRLFGRTNNEQNGLSVKLSGRENHFFYRVGMTLSDYADYRVPTDSIQYYSYYIRLKDQRLRNTAGCERDGNFLAGYEGYNFHTDLRVSDSYAQSGFFANAHGLEVRLSDIDYDSDRRDVSLPLQWVNHLKVQSHTTWNGEGVSAEGHLAYQNNLREEHSEPVSHGYMPMPDGTLERRFTKHTYSARANLRLLPDDANEIRVGTDAEYQHNRRDGWGFILPDFETLGIGIYAFGKRSFSESLSVDAGVRYDHAWTHIHAYNDWYATPAQDSESVFTQRSADVHPHWGSVTWSAGINYATGGWVMKATAGKGFRIPTPKELGADGINYHIFRYERGNAGLQPERSYQLDASISGTAGRLSVQIDPFVNYFPNYIYLNPTPGYVEGLQLYHYTQARVFRWGFEAQLAYMLSSHLETTLKGEYLYARQLSGEKRGYTLPFSPPARANAGVRYTYGAHRQGYVSMDADVVGAQDEIVPPEKPTEGHWTLNLSAGYSFPWKGKTWRASLQAENLLNRRYYDHTSYYRLINVPEPGRNVSLLLGMDF